MRLVFIVSCLVAAACRTTPLPTDRDELIVAGSTVAVLVAPVHDAADHAATCKPWHRLYDHEGRPLTKDLGGLYPHHRGVFVGWNRVRCAGQTFDFWHCNHGETQRVVARTGGGDAAQTTTIAWCAADGTPIVHEQRTVAVRPTQWSGYVLEVTCELRAAGADVELGGDPQHAGCQFRADQQFAETNAPKVEYLRPAGAAGGADDVWTQCRWIAATLPFATGPVVVLRVEHADNPPATWSTRPYGRFGAMCTLHLRQDAPQRLRFAYVVTPPLPLWGNPPEAAYADLAAAAFTH